MYKVIVGLFVLSMLLACGRSNYICECNSTNASFQNIYYNATASEADEYCQAAEELYSPGHINLKCHAFEIEED